MLFDKPIALIGASAVLAAPVAAQTAGDALEQRYATAEARLTGGDESPAAWIELLGTLYALDRPAHAHAAAGRALQRHAKDPGVVAAASRAYFRAGYLDEAGQLLAATPAAQREAAGALVQSKLLQSRGRITLARSVADAVLSTRPRDAELEYQVAVLHGQLQDHDQAARHYARAAERAAQGHGYPLALIRRRCAGRGALHRAAAGTVMNRVEAVGEAPFALPEALPLPTITVRINDIESRMLLDLSGGPAVSLDDDVARRAGLEILADARVGDLTGGVTATRWALSRKIEFGGCRLTRVATQVYDFAPDNLLGIDGIVGAALFRDQRLTLDFEAHRVRLAPSRPESDAAVDASRSVIQVALLGGDQALIPVTIGGRRANAIIDIGYPMTCLSSELLAALKSPQAIRRTPDGAEISGSMAYRVGTRTIVPPGTVALPFIGRETSSTLGTRIDMLIGWDLFGQVRTFAVDYPTNRIIVNWQPAHSD